MNVSQVSRSPFRGLNLGPPEYKVGLLLSCGDCVIWELFINYYNSNSFVRIKHIVRA
jgi:hypothetical protein